MIRPPDVVFVLPDKMGGVMTIVADLLAHRTGDAFTYGAVLTHNRLDPETRFGGRVAADWQRAFEYEMPTDNLSQTARRLAGSVGAGPGVLVCNDFVEIAALSMVDFGRTVIQVLHGDYDYYYDLAARNAPFVDAFVAYSRTVFEHLCDRLPERRATIFHLPYGVEVPSVMRRDSAGAVRLLFVGRLDERKGVFDLPVIDRMVRERGVDTRWTIVGDGPARDGLRAAWSPAFVRHAGALRRADALACLPEHDILVLPSRAEGLSVATMEAMAAGVVPVVSDLASMRELVDEATGIRAPVGDVPAFADAIGHLASHRATLAALGTAARRRVVERYEVKACAAGYQKLFMRWQGLARPRPFPARPIYGSRLDRPWIPNEVVRAIRSAQRWRESRRAL